MQSRIWTAIALLALGICSCWAAAESASGYYKRGVAAEQAGDSMAAFSAYKQAFELKPKDLRYRTTYERMRATAAAELVKQGEALTGENSLVPALTAFLRALDIDPSSAIALHDARALQEEMEDKDHPGPKRVSAAPGPLPPLRLDIRAGAPVTLHMVEDSKNVYQALGKLAGINVLFDPQYNSRRIQIDLQDVNVLDALRIVGDVSNTFWKPVTGNTIFVAQDTRAKRQALGEQAVQLFYLKNVSEQNDFTDVQTALRNLFQDAKIFGLASQKAIMMRGTPDELQLAKMLIAGIDQAKPEVMVDITVMEVSRDKLREIGLSPPTSLTVTSGSSQTLNQIGRTSAYSISVGEAAAEFLLTDSDTRILQNPRLRAIDGQKATLKLGEKLPIATGTYTLATSSTSAAAETQFQYIDVGVNVEMTPAIHSDRDVTLKLSIEVSSQSGTETIEDVAEPVISQQRAEEVIQLKDNEATILAGLLKRQESTSVSGWPGLGELPLVKYFFSTQTHERVDDELVFMIVPHVVRAPVTEAIATGQIDTGTETAIQLRTAPAAAPAASPAQPK